MTSSLKSKFDFSRRRAIFVSTHKLAVYHWEKGDLGSSFLFDVDSDGKAYFERYLRETDNIPTYILVDLFEEEFRRDTAPHAYGSDRAAIIERKKARLFRDTPYYHYKVMGRVAEGRKDDDIMLSAITNPKLVEPWVDLLEQYKVPLVGIYSIPMLSHNLVKYLPDMSENNLIVSIQSISGLRQTFIKNNQLGVSRLIQLPRYGTEPYGPHIKDEVDKIKRYLNSVRLVSSDQADGGNTLNTYYILSGDVMQQIRQEYSDISTAGIYFVDINELLSQVGSSRQVVTPFADQLYIHQLLKLRPGNIYAQPRERRYNTMRNMRIGMLVCSALLLIGGVSWSGFTSMQGVSLRQSTLSAKTKTDFYTTRYQIAREGLPQTPVEPADLKAAVELVEKLQEYKTTPLEMIRIISIAMNGFPSIKLGQFNWVSSSDPNTKVAGGSISVNQGTVGVTNIDKAEDIYDYYEIAVINAEITPFDGNYRQAISLINEYVENLRNQTDVYDVSIINLPLDVSSESSMTGNTGFSQKEAKFTVRLVLGVET